MTLSVPGPQCGLLQDTHSWLWNVLPEQTVLISSSSSHPACLLCPLPERIMATASCLVAHCSLTSAVSLLSSSLARHSGKKPDILELRAELWVERP